MKYLFLFCFLLVCTSTLFSQTDLTGFEKYHTPYEQEILSNKKSTHLEQLMAMGEDASEERTLAVKEEIDAFVSEIKSSKLMRLSEVKLMKALHKKVHERFLVRYKYISPFNEIFETGYYNCVSATALFALVLEELNIPYNIQEQPTHVYILAYPDTKAISVEMTALKDAYYLPARKDISNAVALLLEFEITSKEEIETFGELQVYNAFYNTNSVVDLNQLAGIQYFNEAIMASNRNDLNASLGEICKTLKLYNEEKIRLFKMEVLISLIAEAKFDCMKDIKYLIEYANIEKANKKKAGYEYATFIQEQLVSKGNKLLVDSSHTYIIQTVLDTTLLGQLNCFYYLGLSEYYSNAYNLKKKLEYAELAYNNLPDIPGASSIELWLAQSILQNIEKYDSEKQLVKMNEYAVKYPFLRSHNLFMMGLFYVYTDVSGEYYGENDSEQGKIYFDLALKTRDEMEDQEVLDEEEVGWLFAEAGAYFIRKRLYKEALKVLEDGLKLSPDHERILARLEILKDRMK